LHATVRLWRATASVCQRAAAVPQFRGRPINNVVPRFRGKRTFAGFQKEYRRLVVRWKRQAACFEVFLAIAMIIFESIGE
jgi:hypothetical protein